MKYVLLASGIAGAFLLGGCTSTLLAARRCRPEGLNEINLQITCPDVCLTAEEYYGLGEGCSEK